MEKPYITYTDGPLRPTSFLIRRISEKNGEIMRQSTVEEQREAKERLADVRVIMPGVSAEFVVCGGVPCQWIQLKENVREDKVILYLHGGGWVTGNLRTAKAFGVILAEELKCRVLVAEYRLSPEYPYPDGLNDCMAVYEWLLRQGYRPKDIGLFGDSAGGNLCLAILHRLKAAEREMPACFGGASPVTDIRENSTIVTSDFNQTVLIHEGEEQDIFSLYVRGTAESREHPELSAICGDLTGFPPTLIHSGGAEPITVDNIAFAHKAAAQGVDVQVVVYDGMFHDFTIFGRTLRESRESVAGFRRFFRRNLLREEPEPANRPDEAPEDSANYAL